MAKRTRLPKRILFAEEEQMRLSLPTYHLNFDGVNDKITIPHAARINNLPAGSFTLEFSGIIGGDGQIFAKCTEAEEGFDSYYFTGQGLLFNVANVDFVGYYSTGWAESNFDIQGHHHYEIDFNIATQTAQLFIDGVAKTNAAGLTYTDAPFVYDGSDVLQDLLIGMYPPDLNPFSGKISWIRISNIARHASNFTPPSLTECPPSDGNTVLRLALDEGTGATVNDTSGNDNDGTITGAAWEAD
jgi:hypothetical protein